jgi:hypothetical protein
MHMLGEPRTMQRNPHYDDVVSEVAAFLEERLAFAVEAGVPEERICLDPGIGFGKTVEHNFELIRRLDELTALGRPVVVGFSRKSSLGKLLGDPGAVTGTTAASVGGRGWNRDTGYGILDVNTALARKAPATDPQEPNEDVYLVKPNGLFRAGHPPLTAPARPRRVLAAHLEQGDDPEDVYRAYLPAKGRLTVTVRPGGPVDLEVWGRRTRSVFERGAAAKRDLLGLSAHRRASKEQVVVHGRGSGQYVYLDVILSKKAREAGYTVSVSSARR